MSGKVFLGYNAKSIETSPGGRVTQVVLKVNDDEAFTATAAVNDGITLEADCPWASQEMADNVLASLSGYDYRPYQADGALLEPAVELGDAVTTSGIYSGIYKIAKKFGKLSAADIAAPMKSEEDHELQYKTSDQRKWTRKMQEISATFAVLNDEISAKVDQTGGDNRSFGWSMTVDGMSWYADGSQVMKIDATGLTVKGTIKTGSAIEAGSLSIAGTSISAETLRSGANSGYNWANGSYGSSNSRWDYSLTGGGYGFNFNNMRYSGSQYQQPISASSLLVDGLQYTDMQIAFIDGLGNSKKYWVLGRASEG